MKDKNKISIKNKVKKTCPLSQTSKVIGDYWNILILRQLLIGSKRFNEITDELEGSTSATISLKLKQLTKDGIVSRKQYQCIPLKVEYSITPKGKKFTKVINEIENLSKIL